MATVPLAFSMGIDPGVGLTTASGFASRVNVQTAPGGSVLIVIV
jgi:hypothetical protein